MGNQAKANDAASFGQKLRQAREARNITLQEITAATKIGSRSLTALETDRFDQLPGGIFNKGFVRAYARVVGLDEDKMVAAYMVAAKVAAPETDLETLSTQVSAVQKADSGSMNAATFVGIVAVIVALALGGLWLMEQRKEAKEAAAQQQRSNPVVSATAPVSIPPPTVTSIDPNAAVGGVADPAASAGAATPNAGPNAGQSANQGVNQAGNPVGTKEAAAPVEISVSATSRAWISVSSDGKRVEQLVLDPDNPEMRSRSYKAQEKLLLIVGNPSGVSVSYNGKPAGTLGTEGRRATVTFTPQGIEKR